MLNDIKLALGYNNNEFDNMINSYILACKKDLLMMGIVESKIVESDPLIYSAIMQYVLANMDRYEGKELARNSYAHYKDELRHRSEYIS